jgi:hypothetical protein
MKRWLKKSSEISFKAHKNREFECFKRNTAAPAHWHKDLAFDCEGNC